MAVVLCDAVEEEEEELGQKGRGDGMGDVGRRLEGEAGELRGCLPVGKSVYYYGLDGDLLHAGRWANGSE